MNPTRPRSPISLVAAALGLGASLAALAGCTSTAARATGAPDEAFTLAQEEPGMQEDPGAPQERTPPQAGDLGGLTLTPAEMRDHQFVRDAGLTEEEARCWDLASRLAGEFFSLPELHPMDAEEVAHAIHVVQNKLLSRPTYRRYLERAKKG